MKRLFTFGCSFTSYYWPTWADILGISYDFYENWGSPGAGNHFIFYSLVECIQRHGISKNDEVMIMWSTLAREDRYLNGRWRLEGSVYNNSMSADYIKKHTDPDGYFLTSMSVIHATRLILDSVGCKYRFMSMVPFDQLLDDSYKDNNSDVSADLHQQVQLLYGHTMRLIEPSFYEVIFAGDWSSRDHNVVRFVRDRKEKAIDQFREKYQECAGPDWPKFENYFNDKVKGVDTKILVEIDENFGFLAWKQGIKLRKRDRHPTPLEHLEYLEHLGGFDINDQQRQFAELWEHRVLNEDELKFERPVVKRF